MVAIERTAYPRMKRAPNAKELADWYTPTQKEREHAAATCRGEQSILSFLVLYKAFQRLGYFPSPDDIPAVIVEHIRACVQVSSEVTVSYPPRRLYRHQRAIRAYLGVKPYDEQAERLASETIIRAAQVMDNPADLLNAAIEELVRAHYELPAFSRLSRLTAHLRTQVNDQYFQMVAARLGEETSAPLHTFLLTRNVSTRHSELQRLKAIPKSATLSHLQDMLDHLVWIESFTGIERLLDGIPRAKIKHFAAQARVLDVAELEEVALAKRQTLVCCLLLETQVATRDAIIEMFLKRMARIHTRGKEALELLHQQHRATTEHLLSVFTDVLHTTQEVADDAALGKQVREVLEQEEGGIQGLLEKTEKLASHNGNNYFPLLWQFYHSHRRTLFRLVHLLDIRSTTQDQTVRAALTFLVEHEQHRGKYLPNVIDLSFANEQWHRTIYVRRKKQVLLDRRHLEVCIFTHVAAELKAGDFCVVGSEQFADYREQLLPWETCEPLVAEYCSEVGRPATGKALVEHLKTQLTRIGREIDQGVPTNGGQLSISPKGELILRRGERREVPCEVIRLEAKLTKELPERNVLDILCNVEHWVHWTRHLGPASGSDPKIKDIIERYIITAFCYGCNLGARQTARHMRGIVTAHELSFTHRRHITAEKLDAAIRDIINCYNAFPLPKLWGTGKLAAADGTKLDLYEENLLSEYHIRYGGYGGIAYHHISDTYIALFTHFIACGVWEAVYILDGLLKNTSDIQPDTLHADTQGQATPVFALAYLLGIKLMPRIRNWKDLVFYRPSRDEHYQYLDMLFRGVIDWALIETHFQDLMRVVLSIKAGRVLPSTLLRKLGIYSKKNRLYLAFQELGRVVRTVFLLQYISDRTLREQITATTNKVEAYNAFSKWLFFGTEGVITDNDPVEQEKHVKYTDLIANAIVLQNVVDMTAALRRLDQNGEDLSAHTIAALSPYLRHHIKRFGDYVIDLSIQPEPLEKQMALPLRALLPAPSEEAAHQKHQG